MLPPARYMLSNSSRRVRLTRDCDGSFLHDKRHQAKVLRKVLSDTNFFLGTLARQENVLTKIQVRETSIHTVISFAEVAIPKGVVLNDMIVHVTFPFFNSLRTTDNVRSLSFRSGQRVALVTFRWPVGFRFL